MTTHQNIISELMAQIAILQRAVDAQEALTWYDESQKDTSTKLINVVACVRWGSSTRGAKEMNKYLQAASDKMSQEILRRAIDLAQADAEAGEK